MKTNKKAVDYRVDRTKRLSGGYGTYAAKQNAEALLKRSVMANLLWEDLFYENGVSVVDNIKNSVPQVEPEIVANIAIEARTNQKLRHVPLLIVREMAKLDTHKHLVGTTLPKVILRADEITEFISLYWQDGKQPLSKQVKLGLAKSFERFDEYQFAKYNRQTQVKLRDVLFLVHAKPSRDKEELYKKLAEDNLAVPDTWEVALSSGADKKESWIRLIETKKLGALAFVRNLRNMEDVNVPREIIKKGFEIVNPKWLLPLNYLSAAKFAPRWERELENLMLRGLSQAPKLKGYSIFVVDVSGSMGSSISSKSQFTRMDAAAAMAMLGAEMCDEISIYATAGNDFSRIHNTKFIPPRHGFGLSTEILRSQHSLGGGGIFTRQCLKYIEEKESTTPDRIIVFTDSQDCDYPEKRVPKPFGKKNYIIDVSAHSHGVNYDGVWTAEISGWSEHFLAYIAALENVTQ